MGLNDREYMRDVPVYRDLVHGRSGRSDIPPSDEVRSATPSWPLPAPQRKPVRGGPTTRPWAWFALGAVATLALVAFTLSHRHAPAAGFTPPPVVAPPAPRTGTIAGPDRAAMGSTLTLQGSVAPQETGLVRVEGRWNGGVWMLLGTTTVMNGQYEMRVLLNQRGVIDLRLDRPDGSVATSTITVY